MIQTWYTSVARSLTLPASAGGRPQRAAIGLQRSQRRKHSVTLLVHRGSKLHLLQQDGAIEARQSGSLVGHKGAAAASAGRRRLNSIQPFQQPAQEASLSTAAPAGAAADVALRACMVRLLRCRLLRLLPRLCASPPQRLGG